MCSGCTIGDITGAAMAIGAAITGAGTTGEGIGRIGAFTGIIRAMDKAMGTAMAGCDTGQASNADRAAGVTDSERC